METATALKQQLDNKIAALPTARLVQMAKMLNTNYDVDAMTVQNVIERELEARLTQADFLALMEEFEAELS